MISLVSFQFGCLANGSTELEIVMLALLPDDFSVAVTFRIPLTSTSKTTSSRAHRPSSEGWERA